MKSQSKAQAEYLYFVAFQRFRKELEETDVIRFRKTTVLEMVNKHLLAVLDEMHDGQRKADKVG